MNCPSRTEPEIVEGWNQSPPHLAPETTTRADMNQSPMARGRNSRSQDGREEDEAIPNGEHTAREESGERGAGAGGSGFGSLGESVLSGRIGEGRDGPSRRSTAVLLKDVGSGDGSWTGTNGSIIEMRGSPVEESRNESNKDPKTVSAGCNGSGANGKGFKSRMGQVRRVLAKYAKFVGPGFLVSVAYIDPGNYATDVAAGATYRFKLLFIVLLSNIFAIFLQSLCIKLGSVTGLNLAENCRAHMPRWLNYVLYVFAEAAIIATDIAEVIGTAIALNLLFKLPLVAGCAISIVDVLIILLFYRPNGSMKGLRLFEFFVMLLVLGVVICFCFNLSLIKNVTVGEVFKGYLPSKAIVQSQGLYQSCGILGATVMPHSLYLGSGIVQSRLKDFDTAEGTLIAPNSSTVEVIEPTRSSTTSGEPDFLDEDNKPKYRPSIAAIRSCLSYSITELAISLFTFALFVNSAILIVSGASLSNVDGASSADLFGIHDLLSKSLAPAAGTIFALALLLSGTSAGIVCTIAGQMVSEGQLRLQMRPWMRRLITRSISITPSIIIAGAVGRDGLSAALEGSQVALSIILPFVSAPLIWFTCRQAYMTVTDGESGAQVSMRNHWVTATLAALIWGVIVVMNVALLVLVGMGVN